METRSLRLSEKEIEYTHRVSNRARAMRLTVSRGGDVMVVTPRFMGKGLIERFIRDKSAWVLRAISYFAEKPRISFPKSAHEYAAFKSAALILARNRLEYFNQFYGFQYNNVSIRNQKTRWGSCSRKGNLNFSYKIAILPSALADYIVVHELCHLKEMNHSGKFWEQVAKTVPEYKNARRALHALVQNR